MTRNLLCDIAADMRDEDVTGYYASPHAAAVAIDTCRAHRCRGLLALIVPQRVLDHWFVEAADDAEEAMSDA